jgi:hypothetical protein
MSDSDKEPIKPYRAKDFSAGQETADVVADVLKHAAERDEAAKKRTGPKGQPKWMLPVAMNLGLLAVYFLIAQPQWTLVNPIQPPPPARQVSNLRNAIYLHGIMRIESFRQANGRLPASLEEAGATALVGQVDYDLRADSTYLLLSTVGEDVISYDSATMTVEEFTGPLALGG